MTSRRTASTKSHAAPFLDFLVRSHAGPETPLASCLSHSLQRTILLQRYWVRALRLFAALWTFRVARGRRLGWDVRGPWRRLITLRPTRIRKTITQRQVLPATRHQQAPFLSLYFPSLYVRRIVWTAVEGMGSMCARQL